MTKKSDHQRYGSEGQGVGCPLEIYSSILKSNLKLKALTKLTELSSPQVHSKCEDMWRPIEYFHIFLAWIFAIQNENDDLHFLEFDPLGRNY